MVFWGKKDCISKVRAQEESGRETNKKASREGITRNPRGFTRKPGGTKLPCRGRRALVRGFYTKGRANAAPALLFDTPRPRFKGCG